TKEQIEAEREARAWASLRAERDRRLAETDWIMLPDVPVPPGTTREQWAAYRQALRDVPQQPGAAWDVTWPEPAVSEGWTMPTIAPERQIYADLLVGRPDGVTWESLREYLASATVELGDISGIGTGQSGVDGVVRRASFVLRNDRAGMPGDSFSPRDRQ